jgi:hypothetical protein
MKTSTKTKTLWEACDRRSEHCNSEIGRRIEYGGNGADFLDRREAEELAREIGYRWIKETAFATEDNGSIDYERVSFKRFHRVQPSVITAHARCCRCGRAETFENGVLAYDWKFEHELMHDSRCVDAWESDLAYPDEIFPQRKWVPAGSRFVLMAITAMLEPELESSPAVMSGGEDRE